MADSKRVEHQQAANARRIKYWDDNAKLAVSKGREDLAREALIEKRRFVQRTESLTNETAEHQGILEQYQDDIRQLEDKLKSAREKERLLVQRHIYATSKKRAQQEIRRMDNTDTIIKFEELEHRIDHMEAEADLVNYGKKTSLEEELERLSVGRMEERVEALETIIDDN